MPVFISVVSHGHADLINHLSCLVNLVEEFHVVVKSNKPGDDFSSLTVSENFHWINYDFYLGFGHNNNLVFEYCLKNLGMSSDDYFIVLNPDVIISKENISKLVIALKNDGVRFASVNLYKNKNLTEMDNSIRTFPSFKTFAYSFLGFGNASIIDKRNINEPAIVDWAAGSFLAFSSSHYASLYGFDQRYFMYCEDVDICFRSHLAGVPLMFYPDITAIHLGKHANRNIFSMHFFWHVTSSMRFLLTKIIKGKPKSILTSKVFKVKEY